jgi:hypothetical protein
MIEATKMFLIVFQSDSGIILKQYRKVTIIIFYDDWGQ